MSGPTGGHPADPVDPGLPAGCGHGGDGLGPLVLDTVVRAHAPTVALTLLLAFGLSAAAAVGATPNTWWPAAVLLVVTVAVGRWLERRAAATDRALVAVLDEP